MKYISTFNESTQDSKITDKDLDLIENCFLDYIQPIWRPTPPPEGEFTPQSCKLSDFRNTRWYGDSYFPRGFVSLKFMTPLVFSQEDMYQLFDYIRKTNNKIGTIATVNQRSDLMKYLLWKWVYGFINQISGDVKRCESYGFECYFVTSRPNLSTLPTVLELIIHRKNANQKVSLPNLESILSEILGIMKSIEAKYEFTPF